jgi:hypothetical protein
MDAVLAHLVTVTRRRISYNTLNFGKIRMRQEFFCLLRDRFGFCGHD